METHQLVYYYDALCGWCYGFSPVMERIHKEYHDKIDFKVISGGLFTGNRVGGINEVAPYIKAGAYKHVEQMTGVKFGEAFLNKALDNGNMILNSLYPAIALCIVKEHIPEKEAAYANLLHKMFYVDGMSSDEMVAYNKYAIKIGIHIDKFDEKMIDPIYQKKALDDFETYQRTGLSGFPAVVLETKTEKIALSNGYVNYETLKKKLDQYLD